jgi:MoaA/NifB/PqqE/SkfB family radical SAM enzyme
MLQYAVDFEITNRCNAHCTFCPRDATPHQGLMTTEVFEHSLQRAADIRAVCQAIDPAANVNVSLCGLGEPLLHRDIATFVRRVREDGFVCTMASNAALLNEKRGQALLDAGLQRIFINVGEMDEDYQAVYGLPFEKTRANVVRFMEMSQGACEVQIVLVNHRRDEGHSDQMEEYWRSLGAQEFVRFNVTNRGGSLFVDDMQFQEMAEEIGRAKAMVDTPESQAICGYPFWTTFIGYDGNIYLCCDDWEKQVAVGTVFDADSVLELSNRLQAVRTRQPICKNCNNDPVNRLASLMRDVAEGLADPARVDALADEMLTQSAEIVDGVEQFEDAARRLGHLERKRIPLRVL